MSKQANKKYWEEISQEYDKNVGEKGDVRHEKIINPKVSRLLGDLRGKLVLDAGCGNGYLSRRMAKTAKQVIGVDLTENLIEIAKSRDNPENIEFKIASLENLPFQDCEFDAILSNMMLMDVERLDGIALELGRVLKKNGELVVSIIHPCFENPPRTYSLFDDQGKRIGRVVQKYFDTGLVVDEKQPVVEGQPYQHYHYTISDYLNVFANAGFCLQEMSEPNGHKIMGGDDGGMNEHTPTFLIMKFIKLV